ncbi:MAG: sulfatase-like hydrolase/transferase [Nitrospiraceae bacterium]|nr:sulfatase-like hydrolase/transferase [Nitrospiraceae bacterium]
MRNGFSDKRSASRRDFLRQVTQGVAALALLGGVSVAQDKRKANVLFIISDDLCTALSGYGHPQCKTPNLDRLAKRGVQFERAYTQNPVCGPARAAIMTGLYPASIGATGNRQSDFRSRYPDILTMPQVFRRDGYYTARVSKIYHMGIPGDILEGTAGLDDPLSWDEAVNIKGPEQYAEGEKEDLCPKVTHQGVDFVKVEAEGDDLVHADGMATEAALKMLRAHKDEPFFLAVGMVRPHVPLVAPKGYFAPYPPTQMKLADVPEGDLDDVPKAAQSQTNAVKYGMSEEQQRKTLGAYYASVTYMDAQVGKLLDEVDMLGLADDTIIVFTSDHGYNLGQHTCWQKNSLFEDAVRVPLIIAAPGLGKKGAKSYRVVEHIGLYPTLAALCGLDVPDDLHGRSFAPLVIDPDDEAFAGQAAYTVARGRGESLRTERWRYNLWNDGRLGVELYDHEEDPAEFRNLAADSKYADVVAELDKRLKRHRDRAALRRRGAESTLRRGVG